MISVAKQCTAFGLMHSHTQPNPSSSLQQLTRDNAYITDRQGKKNQALLKVKYFSLNEYLENELLKILIRNSWDAHSERITNYSTICHITFDDLRLRSVFWLWKWSQKIWIKYNITYRISMVRFELVNSNWIKACFFQQNS